MTQTFWVQLFGRDSEYDFGLMFAAPRTAQEKEDERTYATVAPLASDLGLEVDISWYTRSIFAQSAEAELFSIFGFPAPTVRQAASWPPWKSSSRLLTRTS